MSFITLLLANLFFSSSQILNCLQYMHMSDNKEAVNILLQYQCYFSERQKAELLWSRCVNTRGLVGCNIPCDLYMEHLNRRLKMVLKTQGANIHPESVEKAG